MRRPLHWPVVGRSTAKQASTGASAFLTRGPGTRTAVQSGRPPPFHPETTRSPFVTPGAQGVL